MSEENKRLARRWFQEVWNDKNEAAIDAMFHCDGQAHGFPDAQSVVVGPDEFKKVHRTFLGAFPDLRLHIEDIVAEGDRVAIRWSTTMTHLGDHLGFAATGKTAGLEGSSFIVVKDGRILDGWNQMDMQGLVQRLKGTAA